MKINKRMTLIIVSILALLVIGIIIIVNGVNNMSPEKALNNFVKQIEEGNFDDISLTIYYSHIFTPLAITSVKDLINHSSTQKFVFDGNQLAEHIDLLKTISNVELIPTKNISYTDARIHYVFEKKGRKIFDVTIGGLYEYEDGAYEAIIFVNGKKFKNDEILDKIMEPFLP